MIDLEQTQRTKQIWAPPPKRIEAGTQQHVLAEIAELQPMLRIT